MVRNIPPSRDVAKRDLRVERWVNKAFTHTPSGKDDVTKRDTSEDGTKCTTPASSTYELRMRRGTNRSPSKELSEKCYRTCADTSLQLLELAHRNTTATPHAEGSDKEQI